MRVKESIGTSVSCLDTEDLAELAYSGVIGCMDLVKFDKSGLNEMIVLGGQGPRDMDVFQPLIDGIYIPGSQRHYWNGYVDPVDFPLPESGCVYCKTDSPDHFKFVTIKRISKLPKKVVCECKKPLYIYKFINVYVYISRTKMPQCNVAYFCIDKDGAVYGAFDLKKLRYNQYNPAEVLWHDMLNLSYYSAGAISLLADRRYLWNIRTKESLDPIGNAIINFGVEEEMVKSLVFARDEPLTTAGRKRPILHWVAAHRRRLEKKIEVDIRKHLRGVTEFKIEGLHFEITSPTKAVAA